MPLLTPPKHKMQYAADSAPYVRAAGKEAPRKKTDRTKRVPGTKMPFGTTKGAFGKEGKGAKGSKGGKPLAKMVRTWVDRRCFREK